MLLRVKRDRIVASDSSPVWIVSSGVTKLHCYRSIISGQRHVSQLSSLPSFASASRLPWYYKLSWRSWRRSTTRRLSSLYHSGTWFWSRYFLPLWRSLRLSIRADYQLSRCMWRPREWIARQWAQMKRLNWSPTRMRKLRRTRGVSSSLGASGSGLSQFIQASSASLSYSPSLTGWQRPHHPSFCSTSAVMMC